MTHTLLPPNASALQRALADATTPLLDPTPLRHLADADRCPAAQLPWLAWARSVDSWDDSYSDAQRRALIRHSIPIHKRKGTAGAVRRALAALGVSAEFREWRELPGAAPYTFQLTAWVNDNRSSDGVVLSPQLYQRLRRVVDDAKNERSHYQFRVGARFDQSWRIASAAQASAVARHGAVLQAVQPAPARQPLRLAGTLRPTLVIHVAMEAR